MAAPFSFAVLLGLHLVLACNSMAVEPKEPVIEHHVQPEGPVKVGIREKRRTHLEPWGEELEKMYNNSKQIFPDEEMLPDKDLEQTFFSERFGWDLDGFGENPWVGIIHFHPYRIQTNQLLARRSACGAVILARRIAMTMCGCMEFYFMKNNSGVGVGEHTDYNIVGQENFKPKSSRTLDVYQYYVTHGQVRFAPDLKHRVWDVINVHCPPTDYEVFQHRLEMRSYYWNYLPVAVKFTPPIGDYDGSTFMPWPPYPGVKDIPEILNDPSVPQGWKDELIGKRASVVAFSMRHTTATGDPIKESIRDPKPFHNDFGLDIQLEEALVNFEIEITALNDCRSRFIRFSWPLVLGDWETRQRQILCFKYHDTKYHYSGNTVTMEKRKPELCGPALVGFPVLRDGHVMGIVAHASDCLTDEKRPDSMYPFLMVRIMDEWFEDLIDKAVGIERKWQQQEPQSSLFRNYDPAYYSIDSFLKFRGLSAAPLCQPVQVFILLSFMPPMFVL